MTPSGLDKLTLDELQHEAADRDIEGRSSMDKDALVVALEGEGVTLQDVATAERLREIAAAEDIEGRSSMDKAELADAIERESGYDAAERDAQASGPVPGPNRPAAGATNPKVAGPPPVADQPGLGRPANPDPAPGPLPNLATSRVGAEIERARERDAANREAIAAASRDEG